MPPRDFNSAGELGTLYFKDTETGEFRKLMSVDSVEIPEIETPLSEDTDVDTLPAGLFESEEFTIDMTCREINCSPLMKCYLFGMPNNYRKIHGVPLVRHRHRRNKPEKLKPILVRDPIIIFRNQWQKKRFLKSYRSYLEGALVK